MLARTGAWVRKYVCVYALRIVSTDNILCFINTLIIIIIVIIILTPTIYILFDFVKSYCRRFRFLLSTSDIFFSTFFNNFFYRAVAPPFVFFILYTQSTPHSVFSYDVKC